MRKTLTVMFLVLTASSLAACKMFWEHDEKPAAVASTTEPTSTEPAKTDPVATADSGKPATSPEQPTEAAVPATK